jgi:hypothetical protein
MVTYEIDGPDGRTYEIDGPEGATREQIIAAIQSKIGPKEQAGFMDSFRQTAAGLKAAPAAAQFATDAPGGRSALLEAQMSDHAQTAFKDIHNLADAWNWGAQTAGSSMGYLAAPGVAGAAATLMKGPAAGKAVGLGVLGTQYLVENLGRQAGEQQEAIDAGQAPQRTSVTKAAIGAGLQTGADVVGFKFFSPLFKKFPIVGKLLGTEGDDIAAKTADELVTALQSGTLKRRNGMVTGILKGTVFEVPQEIFQQMAERWQAGQPMVDQDARGEYMEAAAGAVLLGSTSRRHS